MKSAHTLRRHVITGWKRHLVLSLGFIGALSCRSLPPSEAPTQEAIVAALQHLAQRWQASGSGAVLNADVVADGVPIPLRCQAYIAGTDSMRLDLWGPLGLPIGQLWATRREFQYYDAVRNVLFQGSWQPALIAHFLGVPLSFEHLVALLLQRPPLPDSLTQKAWDPAKRLLRAGNGREHVLLRLPEWELVAYEYQDSRDTIRITYDDWVAQPPFYARKLRVATARGTLQLQIRSYTPWQSPAVPFVLRIPENAERVVVE